MATKKKKNGNMKLITFKARQQNTLKLEIEHISKSKEGKLL